VKASIGKNIEQIMAAKYASLLTTSTGNSLLLSNFVLIGSKAYERRRKIVLGGQTQKYQRAGEQMSVFIFLWGYAHRYLCIDRNVLQLQRWGVPKWVKIYLELHSIKEKGNWFVHLRMVSISLPLSGNL